MNAITTTRPPRPHIPPAELLAKYRAHGMAVNEVRAAWTTPEGDVVVETDSGNRWRLVDPSSPDGAGLSGLLLEHNPKGYRVGHAQRFTPRSAGVSGDPWTIADLDWAAGKLFAPTIGEQVQDGWAGYRSWLTGGENDFPIRCFALLRSEARGRMQGVTLAEAARRSPLCAALRREIHASGWLSDAALAELEQL